MAEQDSDDETLDFEQSLGRIEAIATQLESGELSLEQSVQAFEQGVSLARRAQKELAEAEQRVNLLLEKDGEPELKDFSEEGADD